MSDASNRNRLMSNTALIALGALGVGTAAYWYYNTVTDAPKNLVEALSASRKISKKFLDEAVKVENRGLLGINNENLLQLACRNGHLEAVKRLLPLFEDKLEELNIYGCNVFHLCGIKTDNHEILQYICSYLENNNKINTIKKLIQGKTHDNQWLALHVYIAQGRRNSFKILFNYIVKLNLLNLVNTQDSEGHTPLIIAAANSQIEILNEILKQNETNLYLLNSKLRSVLYFPSANGNIEIVQLLLNEEKRRKKENLVSEDDKDKLLIDIADFFGKTPIFIACSNEKIEMVKFLIENDANLLKTTVTGESILNICCQKLDKKFIDLLKYLLQSDKVAIEDVNKLYFQKNSFGCGVLHDAAMIGNYEVLNILFETNPVACREAIKSQDNDGLTPIHSTCRGIATFQQKKTTKENLLKTLRLLLQYISNDDGELRDISDYSNSSPLHFLCYNPIDHEISLEALEIILSFKFDLILEDTFGWTGLHALYQTCVPTNKTAEKMRKLLINKIESQYPGYMTNFNKNKERNLNDKRFIDRSGPHNQIPIEKRNSLLNGDISLVGIANYIKAKLSENGNLNIVVLAGAGISVNCGIPDFRSPGSGIYATTNNQFSLNNLVNQPYEFYAFVNEIFAPVVNGKIKPSKTHHFIKLLQDKNLLKRMYTQNIDTLELKAGIEKDKLVEAHGSFASACCVNCKKPVEDMSSFWELISNFQIPTCSNCNFIVRPDVVFFGESPPDRFFQLHNEDLKTADLLIVMGTSLVVYPFASLVNMVPLLTPRVLFNKELVGPFAKVDSPINYRDVAFVGDCDAAAETLVSLLSWDEEFKQAIENSNQH